MYQNHFRKVLANMLSFENWWFFPAFWYTHPCYAIWCSIRANIFITFIIKCCSASNNSRAFCSAASSATSSRPSPLPRSKWLDDWWFDDDDDLIFSELPILGSRVRSLSLVTHLHHCALLLKHRRPTGPWWHSLPSKAYPSNPAAMLTSSSVSFSWH